MGNLLTKKENIKSIENYINCDDVSKLDTIIRVFKDNRINKKLSVYTDSFDFDFDYNFNQNIKYNDKFKYKYIRHSLAICLSFLDDEYKRISLTSKEDPSGFIDELVSPVAEKLVFTIRNYTFFNYLHPNCVKIQRWYRKNRPVKVGVMINMKL
jgi:hypothetical protein